MNTSKMLRRMFATKPRTYRNPKPVRRPRLAIQELETRSLMAASLTASLNVADGILRVEGTYSSDQVHVRHSGGAVRIDGITIAVTNGETTTPAASVPRGQISKIVVAALDGNDLVQMHDTLRAGEAAIPMVIHGGSGNDTLIGGRGADSIYGESGADSILGGAGKDLLYGDSNPAAAKVAQDYGLNIMDEWQNWYGKDEKWLLGRYVVQEVGREYYITPDGGLYEYSQFTLSTGQNTITDVLVETLDPSYYQNTRKLEIERGLYHYDLYYGYGGRDEKWLGGIGESYYDKWFFITPAGELYRWNGEPGFDGNAEHLTGTLIATLDFSYLADPHELVNAATDDAAADILNGQDGDDYLDGGAGNDYLDGRDGNDTLSGLAGNDTLYGWNGNDSMLGGDGDDFLNGQQDHDWMNGQDGNDTLWGFTGNDTLFGWLGDDSLLGGAGKDYINGQQGNDWLNGQEDDDLIIGFDGRDSLYGWTGNDTLYGGAGDDYMDGQQNNDTMDGQEGNDTLIGNTGADWMNGSSGNDSLYGGTNNDSLYGGFGNDFLDGQEGNDTLDGQDDDDTLLGSGGHDWMNGSFGNDSLYGGFGNDSMYGGFGNDLLDGQQDNDTIDGQQDNDTLIGFSGRDWLNGSFGDDYLYGGIGNDSLYGGYGNDFLDGQENNDTLDGQQDNDTMIGTSGTDYIAAGQAGDVIIRNGFWVTGPVGQKWLELGGPAGFLGAATTGLSTTPDGVGQFAHFVGGSVYWHPTTGAHVIYGAIRDRWAALGWERSALGYPTSDEYSTANGWRIVNFETGSIVWRADVGARMSFDRNEMLRLFDRFRRDAVVDGGEVAFLRAIVSDFTVHMPDDVRNLLNKVAYGDVANFEYQGQPMGNLVAGSSHVLLQNLVNKWFRGTDLPYANHINGNVYGYAPASGTLFGPAGPQMTDIDQGGTGDCFFMASLGAVLHKDPQAIRDMFVENSDGTFTVRFYRDGRAQFVTVNKWLPVNGAGKFVFANATDDKLLSDTTNVLWAALAEKAYAQLNQSGWILQDGSNSYYGITGGRTKNALSHITGRWADEVSMEDLLGSNLDDMVDVAHTGKLITLSSETNAYDIENHIVVPGHAYVLVGIFNDNETFVLYNPWGKDQEGFHDGVDDGYITLSRYDMLVNFRSWTWGD